MSLFCARVAPNSGGAFVTQLRELLDCVMEAS
jgi:hypothetical protein